MRRLARRVDVGQQQLVGAGQRGREVGQQVAGAREAVRLERHHQPPAVEPRRGDGGRELGRVVAVVVDHQDAADLAAHARTGGRPPGTAASASPAVRERDAEEVGHAQRRQRVARVVDARHADARLAVRRAAHADPEAGPVRAGVQDLAAPVARRQAVGDVALADERRQARPRAGLSAPITTNP